MALDPDQKRPSGRSSERKRRFPRPFGRYILEKVLSRGGMGEVYLAVVKRLDRRCVIKTIRGDLTGEEEFVGRFADEAKILVRAAHDNIIRYFDAGRVGSDYYIAMEYVHGRDLGDVLDRAYERGEPMPASVGLYISSKLLEGLHYAHELEDERGRRMGLVHRDISPQNVLIGFDGSVKLIDFGLARTDLLPNRTQGALAVGKYGYMSPEQARHEPLDGRADIYSAGVMLFEVFTGDRLVDEQDQATLWQRVLNPKHRHPRSVLPSLPREIDHLVMRAVAVRPEDRFPTARSMADAVNALRGKDSDREALKSYLRYLYPRVDFTPPPIPPLDDLAEGVEQSVIFATSREGARSVFGRGELPIEGTMQLDAGDVRKEIERHRRLAQNATLDLPAARAKPPEILVAAQALGTDLPALIEVTPVDGRLDPARAHLESARQAEQPTQVARLPSPPAPDDEATAFMRAPEVGPGSLEGGFSTEPSAGFIEAPFGRAAMPKSERDADDEQTVMMSAPPRALFQSGPRVAEVFDPEAPPPVFSAENDEPTTQESTRLGDTFGLPGRGSPQPAVALASRERAELPSFDEVTRVPRAMDPGRREVRAERSLERTEATSRELDAPFDLTSVSPSALQEALDGLEGVRPEGAMLKEGAGVRNRAILERVKTEARGRLWPEEAPGAFSPPALRNELRNELRSEPAAYRTTIRPDEPTRALEPPLAPDSRPPAPILARNPPSAVLIAALVAGGAVLVLILVALGT